MSEEITATFYDEDYFERGLETGKSCYQNYRWIPELTIPMAMSIVDHLGIQRGQKVLDLGCSKGYLVKALRLLSRDAYGVDISPYAITNCDPSVKEVCKLVGENGNSAGSYGTFDVVIAKDVLEHIPEIPLWRILKNIKTKRLFAVIPLGDGTGYRAWANNLDKSHCNCGSEDWWTSLFEQAGWASKSFAFQVSGIKESYYAKYPKAHGFWVLERW